MKIGEIVQSNTLYELEKWAKSNAPLFEEGTSAEKLSKSLIQRAMDKFKKQPAPTDEKTKEMEDYMAQLEHMLGKEEEVEKSTLKKFFGFFRSHPRMIGLGVMILMLLSPMLPSIAIIGLSLEKILSITLAGLYAIDIASPAVKTALEI
jgi:hypothetical protein|tara:strand:+ start:1304 stop:1750 length:447 start_codon:yes stop_codon:yes gene_type:complete